MIPQRIVNLIRVNSDLRPSLVISVVVSTLNAAKSLQRCINSYSRQSYCAKELVIVDGGSTDGTTDLLAANSKVISRYVSEPDKGISDAWNKALSLVSGDWIIFLGADDYFWSDTILEDAASKLLTLAPDTRIGYGRVVTVTEYGEFVGIWGRSWEETEVGFLSAMNVPHQGVFHRSILFKELGGFDVSLRYAGDYDLLLRSVSLAKPVYIGDLKLVAMTVGGVSGRPSLSWKVLDEFRVARKNRGFPSITWTWAWNMAKALGKLGLATLMDDHRATAFVAKLTRLVR